MVSRSYIRHLEMFHVQQFEVLQRIAYVNIHLMTNLDPTREARMITHPLNVNCCSLLVDGITGCYPSGVEGSRAAKENAR